MIYKNQNCKKTYLHFLEQCDLLFRIQLSVGHFFLLQHTYVLFLKTVSEIAALAISSTLYRDFIKCICISLQPVIISIRVKKNTFHWLGLCLLMLHPNPSNRTEKSFSPREKFYFEGEITQFPARVCLHHVQSKREFLSIENSAISPLFWSQAASVGVMSQIADQKNNNITVDFTGCRENRGTAVTEQFLVKRRTSSRPQ